jgi:hypothetical protein
MQRYYSNLLNSQFTPDHIFAKTGSAYIKSDVYCGNDLVQLFAQYGTVHYFTTEQFYNFTTVFGERYKSIDHLSTYHIIKVEDSKTKYDSRYFHTFITKQKQIIGGEYQQ